MEHHQDYYNGWIVLLSCVIAIMASYSALNLAGKISRSKGRTRIVWLIVGSWIMGTGVWSMHFMGMLAFHMDTAIHYDSMATVLSALSSMLASYIAFRLTLSDKANLWRFGIGGFFMGSGILTMHYLGMAAINNAVQITYDPFILALSALIAMLASYVALFLFWKFRHEPDFSRWKLVSAIVMAIAICGMHYTGMAASHFDSIGTSQKGLSMDVAQGYYFLLIAVSLATFFLLAVSWGAIFFDRNVLERMAFTDALTGLPNRHDLQRHFDQIDSLQVSGALLFIGLDRFKTINDTLGHDFGDLLLHKVSNRLRIVSNETRTLFRLGGDEFLLITPTSEQSELNELAQQILQEIRKPYFIEEHELYITASIGISLAPAHGRDRSSLLKAADTAMFRAKGAGKNRIQIFDEQMDRQQFRKRLLEKDLRKALVHQEFRVFYQPKWDSDTNRLVGMEALIRWQHPELGLISPVEFIPIAEETGMIVAMTRWILKEVCLQNRIWHDQADMQVGVSVNMSIRVFESQALYEMVVESLAAAKLEAQFLELEITESIAMQDVNDTILQLQEIRKLGVKVSLDDFGTGYSSLGSLDELPVDILKIDQIFIRKSTHPAKQAIISNIIAIAHNLNLDIVAEGVETAEQIEFLQSRGCHVMQGYYYGKPMPPDEMDKWLEQSRQQSTIAGAYK